VHSDLTPRRWTHAVLRTQRLQRAGERNPESGAVIILALAFLTIILTLTVALFGLANAGAASLRHFRFERVRRYNADAALQATVQWLKDTPTMGVTGGPTCGMNYAMQESTGGFAQPVLATGSYLTVSCAATSGVTSGGADGDGGQAGRDVTIEVRCNSAAPPGPHGNLVCNTGAKSTVLARARVRFDIDYGITPTAPNCGPTVALCSASTVRAVVPKVVYWSIKG